MPPRKQFGAPNAALFRSAAGAVPNVAALFGQPSDFPEVRELPLEQVHPNPDQPRKQFDEEGLRLLADSIGAKGQLQPILVREGEGAEQYIIVAGERRWRACRLAGRASIYAVITKGDPDEIALIENTQRQDLDPFELADGIAKLLGKDGATQADVARLIGRSKAEVSRLMAVHALPTEIRNGFTQSGRTISRSVLFEIADAPTEQQLALWQRAQEGATVRELRAAKLELEAAATSHDKGGEGKPPADAQAGGNDRPKPASPSVTRNADAGGSSVRRFSQVVGRFEQQVERFREVPLDDEHMERLRRLHRLIGEVLER
ncbi:chromosome partitioning protein (modular protein) (plasmid) [Azospirillum baldaniorum]|uniref:Chromosome partitioning protein (Modular protein) n=1 Tax=Azospirillum baldaniorum TaxID=1064539 RepID=A0A9P1NSF6_9PROT|nr:ParB/RepB/Spo0J family partition protein [Azospirillum baldaniorum]AWJ94381.1 chromosome partitioning protein (modular protein) [Azospirillum baldaniorum]TWA70434.1 ParB family chromosome partitioning protein [Azospirillum brasilense]CCD03837.1 chromosome partitioning protein (modular protein) [Azospirillum baldaniorum]